MSWLARAISTALLLTAVAVGPSAAHPLLLDATPAPGSVLPEAPSRVVLRFNNRIEKALSRVRLVDGRGQGTTLAAAPAEGGDDQLAAVVPRLAAGTYRVEWRALSADGHFASGSFSFRVAP